MAESIESLKREARACRACPLWANATQAVFGEGPADASLLFVGEQPGDQEDILGRPFVGPAGKLFDRMLAEAGIERSEVYVTNAVKHFKNEPRGKRRLHKRPNVGEIEICHRWLFDEIAIVNPALIVALGATAIRSMTGRALLLAENRGKTIELPEDRRVFLTIHPSALLRIHDSRSRAAEYARAVNEIRMVRRIAEEVGKPRRELARQHLR